MSDFNEKKTVVFPGKDSTIPSHHILLRVLNSFNVVLQSVADSYTRVKKQINIEKLESDRCCIQARSVLNFPFLLGI